MTPKQKLRSLEVDMKLASRKFSDIQKYYELEKERIFLKFEIENEKI